MSDKPDITTMYMVGHMRGFNTDTIFEYYLDGTVITREVPGTLHWVVPIIKDGIYDYPKKSSDSEDESTYWWPWDLPYKGRNGLR